jgi:type II secretory pathway predicted ATPase ExeA
MVPVKARYVDNAFPDYQGNPLIEALPPRCSDEQLLGIFENYPTPSTKERRLGPFDRIEYLSRLDHFVQPLPEYLHLYRAVDRTIRKGYSVKNPLSPTTQNYLHYPLDTPTKIEPVSGYFRPKGCVITVIGESGAGKTTMLEQVLSPFPQIIDHLEYHGGPLNLRQVVWAKVDCPHDSSVRQLCNNILRQLDELQGFGETKPSRTIPDLLLQIEARVKSSFLGLLVIDEMQHLTTQKTKGSDSLLKFLHNLVNNLGIPLLFCGPPPFDELLSRDFKTARRAESEFYLRMELLNNDELWDIFFEKLWRLQWTDQVTPHCKMISDHLHNLSAGNVDMAVRIFREAQRLIIGSGAEHLNDTVLDQATAVASQATARTLNEMRHSHAAIFKRQRKETAASQHAISPPPAFHKIPGDLTRVHHPEFAAQMQIVKDESDLTRLIADPDAIQQAAEQADPINELKNKDMLCDDPLQQLGT